MFRYIIILCFSLITAGLNAKTIDLNVDSNKTLVKYDDVKFALELSTQADFWTPGLSENILEYTTEGLYLVSGKFKIKLYDTDVFTIEKYTSVTSSDNQKDLLAFYEDNQKHDASLTGLKVSLQLMKVINYLFDKKWLEGLNYEFNTRDFIGDATIKVPSVYWYGKLQNAEQNTDFSLIQTGQVLAFKTEFTSHRLAYMWEDVWKQVKGSYFSFGAFYESWSKPTFVGDSIQGTNFPIIFDADYDTTGVSTSIGIKQKNYDINAFLGIGIDNNMKIIQKGDNYSSLNRDINVFIGALTANYRFLDVYSNKYFNMDVVLGGEMQYNKINQDGVIELDAETLYAVNAGIEIVF